MNVGFMTDKGKLRECNEDAGCFFMKERVFVVADGVGGNNSGEIASRTAVEEIARFIDANPLDGIGSINDIQAYFNRCIDVINMKILSDALYNKENKGMATTMVVVYFYKDTMYVMNIGDSRAYIFRNGMLTQITEDHTYVNSLIKAGVISAEEAEVHENRNMITRAVGAEPGVKADFFVTKVMPGDIVLMCTDGLYGEVDDDYLTAKLAEGLDMTTTSRQLTDMANASGGTDNITVICIEVTEEDINE